MYLNHRETVGDAPLEIIVSMENVSLKTNKCMFVYIRIKSKITQPYAKKFGRLLVNNDKIVNWTKLNYVYFLEKTLFESEIL